MRFSSAKLCTRCWRFYWCRHHQRFVYLHWLYRRHHHREYESFFRVTFSFFFFVNSHISETAGWCCWFFFLLIIPFSCIFSAFVVYILSCEPSLAIFSYHSFFVYSYSKKTRFVFFFCFSRCSITFFLSVRFTFRILYIISLPVLHLIHTVPCRALLFMFLRLFSVISLLLCFDAEILFAVFTDVLWSRLRVSVFLCLFVCLFNNKICCRAPILRQLWPCQKTFNEIYNTAFAVKRIINVLGDDFFFVSI